MSEERGKPGALSWLALFLAPLVLYLLSENMVTCLIDDGVLPKWLRVIYAPMEWITKYHP